jgi:quinol-cytochrome oxidoreductase complex cytochrome b subunit
MDKEEKTEARVHTWPHLMAREFIVALALTVFLMGISLVFNAPLEEHANPEITPNPAKAPWYFLGVQELVSYDAFLGGVLIPTLIVLALFATPYIDKNPRGVGIWFSRERKLAILLFALLVIIWTILIIIGVYFRGPEWRWFWPWESWEIT